MIADNVLRMKAIVLLAYGASAIASEGGDVVGSYVYEGSDAHLVVHLKEEGACMAGGSLAKHVTASGATGVFVNCRYSVEGNTVTLEWTLPVPYAAPEPLEFTYVFERLALRMDGESERLLKRTAPQWRAP